MNRKILFLLVFIFSGMALMAQTVTRTTSAASNNGIVFSLPRTRILVVATAEHVTEIPGPFYRYAEMYLNISNIIQKKSSKWSVKHVDLVSQSEPDSSKMFSVDFSAKRPLAVYLNKFGLISGVNTKVESDSDVEVKDSETVNYMDKDTTFKLELLSEDALAASSIPKMAELAADEIYHIRESRLALLTGDNDKFPDGKALKIMLKRLDETERELTALFVGKRVVEAATRTYVIDCNQPVNNQVAFRISSYKGLLASDNLLGDPVYYSVVCQNRQAIQTVSKEKMSGFPYNVPGSAAVSISDGQNVLAEHSFVMPQLGTVAFLSAKLNYKIVYNTQTGTILSIENKK